MRHGAASTCRGLRWSAGKTRHPSGPGGGVGRHKQPPGADVSRVLVAICVLWVDVLKVAARPLPTAVTIPNATWWGGRAGGRALPRCADKGGDISGGIRLNIGRCVNRIVRTAVHFMKISIQEGGPSVEGGGGAGRCWGGCIGQRGCTLRCLQQAAGRGWESEKKLPCCWVRGNFSRAESFKYQA